MRVGLLGGLEVLDDDGHDVPIAGAKLRALLAMLALHAGRVVPTEHLIDALWGETPPAAVRNSLQGLASKRGPRVRYRVPITSPVASDLPSDITSQRPRPSIA